MPDLPPALRAALLAGPSEALALKAGVTDGWVRAVRAGKPPGPKLLAALGWELVYRPIPPLPDPCPMGRPAYLTTPEP